MHGMRYQSLMLVLRKENYSRFVKTKDIETVERQSAYRYTTRVGATTIQSEVLFEMDRLLRTAVRQDKRDTFHEMLKLSLVRNIALRYSSGPTGCST